MDNDGDVDVVITNNNAPVRLLLNQTIGGSVDARPVQARTGSRCRSSAPSGNRFAIGARVGVVREGQPMLWRRVRTDGSYLSASDDRVHIGLGTSDRVSSVDVEWPDGLHESFTGIAIDRIVSLKRGDRTTAATATK